MCIETCELTHSLPKHPAKRSSWNGILLNLVTSALKPLDEGPPPTCPFINLTMRKSEPPNRQLSFPSISRVGRLATDLAVNRVSLFGEAPLTRGYLCVGPGPVNRLLQFCFNGPVAGRIIGGFPGFITSVFVDEPSAARPNRAGNRPGITRIRMRYSSASPRLRPRSGRSAPSRGRRSRRIPPCDPPPSPAGGGFAAGSSATGRKAGSCPAPR